MSEINPYEPSKSAPAPDLHVPDEPGSPRWLPASLLLLVPGTTVGLHIGVALDQGVNAPFERTLSNPIGALQFFAVFGLGTLACTFLYRVPRWFLLGRHRIWAYSAFLSGVLIVCLAFSLTVAFQRLGVYTPIGPPSVQNLGVLIATAALSICVGVEFEAFLARLRVARSR